MLIGVDENTHLIYQGQNTAISHALWPTPVLFPAKLLDENDVGTGVEATGLSGANLLFREDYFDPVTRIRRGRLYEVGNLERWQTPIHPMGDAPQPYGIPAEYNIRVRDLRTCRAVNFSEMIKNMAAKEVRIALGTSVASSVWTLVVRERIWTNEDLLTVRSSINYSSLPKLRLIGIGDADKDLINLKYANLVENIFVATPDSITDCCRDLCEAVLLAKIRTNDSSFSDGELNKSIPKFEKEFAGEFKNVLNYARSLQILHPRRKIAEIVNRDIRPLSVHDSELAVMSVGAILCDLRLGVWI